MKKLFFLFCITIFLISTSSIAESLKGGYPACISEELFGEFSSAAAKKDEAALKYLVKNGCIITKPGISVSVLDTSWRGRAKVRAYVGNDAMILWTNTENIAH